jgi:hypothetical protein
MKLFQILYLIGLLIMIAIAIFDLCVDNSFWCGTWLTGVTIATMIYKEIDWRE